MRYDLPVIEIFTVFVVIVTKRSLDSLVFTITTYSACNIHSVESSTNNSEIQQRASVNIEKTIHRIKTLPRGDPTPFRWFGWFVPHGSCVGQSLFL